METNPDLHNNHIERSAVQLEPIGAIFMLDDYLEPCAVKPVSSVNEPVPFDPEVTYRVYFDHLYTRHEIEHDDYPHADIFHQSDGERCVEYDFLPTATPAEVKSFESVVKTRVFLQSALHRWGGFKLLWGVPFNGEEFEAGANLLLYYDDELAFNTLRCVGMSPETTYGDLLADYMYLLQAVSGNPIQRQHVSLQGGEPYIQ